MRDQQLDISIDAGSASSKDGSAEFGGIGADDGEEEGAVAEEEEGGEGGDGEGGGEVGEEVGVDLDEGHAERAKLEGEGVEEGGDGVAGTAPLGEEVGHDKVVGRAGRRMEDETLPVCHGVDVLDETWSS